MCGPACDRSASPDSKFRNGKRAMARSFPAKCMNGFPWRLTQPTITARYVLYGVKLSRIQRRILERKREPPSRRLRCSPDLAAKERPYLVRRNKAARDDNRPHLVGRICE